MNPAYRTAVFAVGKPPPSQPFWVVTACNPGGRTASEGENRRADLRLREALVGRGESPSRVTGLAPDRSHAEPGWTIRSAETARELAGRFRQEAYYRIHDDRLVLVETESGTEEDLGAWPPRIVGDRV